MKNAELEAVLQTVCRLFRQTSGANTPRVVELDDIVQSVRGCTLARIRLSSLANSCINISVFCDQASFRPFSPTRRPSGCYSGNKSQGLVVRNDRTKSRGDRTEIEHENEI